MSQETEPFVIVIPIYQGVDLLDVAAPYEMFNWLGENETWLEQKKRPVEVWLAAERTDCPVFTRDRLQLTPKKAFKEISRVDLLWTPGGSPDALAREMENAEYIGFLQRCAEQAEWVTSVCEGAMLLAAAGLLDGYEATTHWAFLNCFSRFPKVRVAPGFPRFVQSGNRVTGGGISSGLDEALGLIVLLAGWEVAEDIQLTTQYFPHPPVAGTIPEPGTCPLPPPKTS